MRPDTPLPVLAVSRDAPWLLMTVVLATLVVLSAQLGLRMSIGSFGITPLWPPSGVALAAVLLAGRRAVAGIALGALGQYLAGLPDLALVRQPPVAGALAALVAMAVLQPMLGG